MLLDAQGRTRTTVSWKMRCAPLPLLVSRGSLGETRVASASLVDSGESLGLSGKPGSRFDVGLEGNPSSLSLRDGDR